MKKSVIIICAICAIISLILCFCNPKPQTSKESIDRFKITINEFAEQHKYQLVLSEASYVRGILKNSNNVQFLVSLHDNNYTNLVLMVPVDICFYDYLEEYIELVNSISKRQFTLSEIKEFIASDEYLKTTKSYDVLKNKEIGWFSDTIFEYSENEYYNSMRILTEIDIKAKP